MFSQPLFAMCSSPGVLSSVKRLDAGGEEWQAVPSMPSARRLCTATACNGALGDISIYCKYGTLWLFPNIGVPQNGWFIMETLLKWMIWGYHYFRKQPYDDFYI